MDAETCDAAAVQQVDGRVLQGGVRAGSGQAQAQAQECGQVQGPEDKEGSGEEAERERDTIRNWPQ